jgi:hypothetical protein
VRCHVLHSSDGRSTSVAMGHHSSDRTAAVSHLPVGTEGYEPLVQRRIVAVNLYMIYLLAIHHMFETASDVRASQTKQLLMLCTV